MNIKFDDIKPTKPGRAVTRTVNSGKVKENMFLVSKSAALVL